MKRLYLALLLLVCAVLISCSTTKSRIKEHQALFNSYPPEAQAQIQTGNIDVGFTEDMVYMAKGDPTEKSTTTRQGKSIILWKYAKSMPSTSANGSETSSGLSGSFGYPTIGPGPVQSAPASYQRAYEIIEFEKGKVTRWSEH